jgi:hypothetical protein
MTLALHFVGKTVAPSDFGVSAAGGSWARRRWRVGSGSRRCTLPYILVITDAVDVADAVISALFASPIVVARKKPLFGGVQLRKLNRFALARRAAIAVAVKFSSVVRAHFGEPLLTGTGG